MATNWTEVKGVTRSGPAAPTAARRQPASRGRWNTLQVLRGMRAILLLVDLLLLLLFLSTATEGRDALRWMADRGVAALVSAERIQVSLERMEDTSTREELQRSGRDSALAQAYEDRRSETVRALMQAAQSSPDETAGESSLETIQLGLGTYERLIDMSRDLHTHGEHGATGAYLQATSFMQGRLLPVSRTVKTLELTRVTSRFEREQRRFNTARGLLIAFFVLEVMLLIAVQVALSRRTHRVLNAALASGTLLLIVFAIHLSTLVHAEQVRLESIQTEGLNAVQGLWSAREFAYKADLDLGLGLAAPSRSALGTHDFERDAAQVVSTPLTLTSEQLDAALRESRSVPGFSGLIAEELARAGNEEKETLLRSVDAWQVYLKERLQIQRFQSAGQLEKATQMFAGSGEQPTVDSLARFDEAVQEALRDRQAVLDSSLRESASALSRLELEAALVTMALAALILLGFQPRLREYR